MSLVPWWYEHPRRGKKQTMKVFAVTVACVILCFTIAFAQTKNTSLTDDKFVRAALAAGTDEIKEGTLYADAGNSLVQTYATRMVKDHSEANTQLLSLARELNITVPNGTLPESGQSEQSPLPQGSPPQSRPSNSVSPKKYFETQVADHEKVIALFKNEIASGSNARVKAYAQKTLPVLETHLALAQKDLKGSTH